MENSKEFRLESDSLGDVRIPAGALWGAQTQRAVDNFTISSYPMPAFMRRALALIKYAAALANADLGKLDQQKAQAISNVALRIWNGQLAEAFPVEVFQTGSGTSWNMNMNEVIARCASAADGILIHPNDHVNMGQSSNDVIPSAINIACLMGLVDLRKAICRLRDEHLIKGKEFFPVVKLGRTHLQDAVPVRLGDSFLAVAAQLDQSLEMLDAAIPALQRLALGGTAAGTGLNTHPDFASRACKAISAELGQEVQAASIPSAEMNSRLPQVFLMSAMQLLATILQRWSIDLRLMSSGPNGGLGEISLPELQPGSSIMPGKINPVIPEAVQQLSVHVAAKQGAVAAAAAQGPLELNIMFPLLAYESLESLRLLTNACDTLGARCVAGIQANPDVCRQQVEKSLALVTRLAEDIGYDRAAKIALRAQREQKSLREILMSQEGFTEDQCNEVLDPESMLPPFL